jgi:hypothetical protein
MSQPVKLSDSLVLDARLTGKAAERSIAGQIEFWAGLGRAVESLLHIPEVLALRRSGAARPLSECLAEPGTAAGEKRVADYLKSRPYPHYEAAPGAAGLLVRIDEKGKRTIGKFVNRRFTPVARRTR